VQLRLEQPNLHSVHCLVDVNACVTSPFELLVDPQEPGELYRRGWQVSDEGRSMLVALAREVGSCQTCYGAGDLQAGFRAAVLGTVVNLGTSSTPPLLEVESVQYGNATEFCASAGGAAMPQVFDDLPDVVATESNLNSKYYAHGALMLIGWGWLLPMGAIFAKLFKHRPDAIWFQLHRTLQVSGLMISTIGFIIALKNFKVFQDKGFNTYKHGVMGITVMVLGWLQPMNALLRPLPTKDGEVKETIRWVWEMVHKGFGWTTLAMAVATICLGTTLLPFVDDQKTFQLAYGIGAGGCLLLLAGALWYDGNNYTKVKGSDNTSAEEKDKMNP
jgi:hypothetical protein